MKLRNLSFVLAMTPLLCVTQLTEAKEPPAKESHSKSASAPKKAPSANSKQSTKAVAAQPPAVEDHTAELRATLEALRKEIDQLKQQMNTMSQKVETLSQPPASQAAPTVPVSAVEPQPKFIDDVAAVKPEFVKLITGEAVAFNSSNPSWSPRATSLAYEKSTEKNREIIIAEETGKVIKKVAFTAGEEDLLIDELLSGATERVSYNAGISWSPSGDRFVYMSNGGEGNYDLYLGDIGMTEPVRLTKHPEKDGHAHWSPSGENIVFVSSRNGTAQLFVMNAQTHETKAITHQPKSFFYPVWSPNGADVVVTYGDNDNHDIVLIKNAPGPKPEIYSITDWSFDDLRPRWSPDGKRIAFYSNYNSNPIDDKVWSLFVVDVENPRLFSKDELVASIVASNIDPDIESGPAWMPDGKNIIFVKKDEKNYNPLYVVNVMTKANHLIETKTKINHDVSCSVNGMIAFRAQQDQWDRIFVTKLPAMVN